MEQYPDYRAETYNQEEIEASLTQPEPQVVEDKPMIYPEDFEHSEVKRREQESNDAIKALKAKNGKDYFAPDYSQQEASFRNSNSFNY